jgi:hypothetical protein
MLLFICSWMVPWKSKLMELIFQSEEQTDADVRRVLPDSADISPQVQGHSRLLTATPSTLTDLLCVVAPETLSAYLLVSNTVPQLSPSM